MWDWMSAFVSSDLRTAELGGARRRGATTKSRDVLEALQEVAHALALGAEVCDVLRVRGDDGGHPLGDLEAEALEAAVLGRVGGDDRHRGDAEVDEDLGADAVLAAVGRQAEVDRKSTRLNSSH